MRTHEKHGYYYHPLYRVWASMLQRCTNPKDKHYYNYGGRGIKVCDEWLNSGKAFIEWALQNGWVKGLEIDRIATLGNYEPNNCRFVTRLDNAKNQAKHRRRPRTFTKKSGLPIGVTFNQGKYQVRLRVEGKSVYLGGFDTVEEAARKYQENSLRPT